MADAILDAAETDPPDLIYLTAGLWRESETRRSAGGPAVLFMP